MRGFIWPTEVEPFAAYCAERGWTRVPTRGRFEALRMVHREQGTLLLHRRARAGGTKITVGVDQAFARALLQSYVARTGVEPAISRL